MAQVRWSSQFVLAEGLWTHQSKHTHTHRERERPSDWHITHPTHRLTALLLVSELTHHLQSDPSLKCVGEKDINKRVKRDKPPAGLRGTLWRLSLKERGEKREGRKENDRKDVCRQERRFGLIRTARERERERERESRCHSQKLKHLSFWGSHCRVASLSVLDIVTIVSVSPRGALYYS